MKLSSMDVSLLAVVVSVVVFMAGMWAGQFAAETRAATVQAQIDSNIKAAETARAYMMDPANLPPGVTITDTSGPSPLAPPPPSQ